MSNAGCGSSEMRAKHCMLVLSCMEVTRLHSCALVGSKGQTGEGTEKKLSLCSVLSVLSRSFSSQGSQGEDSNRRRSKSSEIN